MSYKALDLCKDQGGFYDVEPAVMFPATIARIKAVLAGAPPTEIVSNGWTGNPLREPVADRFLRAAERMPAEAWDLALEPFSEFPENDPEKPDQLLLARLELRATALTFAESWFKRALALAAGKGIRIHILKDKRYRR